VFSVGFSGDDKNLSAALSLDYFQFLPEDENPQTTGSVFSSALEQKKKTTTLAGMYGGLISAAPSKTERNSNFFCVALPL